MDELVEYFEMVSLNAAALSEPVKLSVANARLALEMFQRAVQQVKADLSGMPSDAQ